MKLSEQPEYLIAIPAKIQGDYSTARENLKVLIAKAQNEKDNLILVELLQTLGDIEALDNHFEKAHNLHNQAIALDNGHPLTLLHYAKSLLNTFNQPEKCLQQIQAIRSILDSKEWVSEQHDLPIEWYIDEINQLIVLIENSKQ